eukprot:Pgem_evm1s1262
MALSCHFLTFVFCLTFTFQPQSVYSGNSGLPNFNDLDEQCLGSDFFTTETKIINLKEDHVNSLSVLQFFSIVPGNSTSTIKDRINIYEIPEIVSMSALRGMVQDSEVVISILVRNKNNTTNVTAKDPRRCKNLDLQGMFYFDIIENKAFSDFENLRTLLLESGNLKWLSYNVFKGIENTLLRLYLHSNLFFHLHSFDLDEGYNPGKSPFQFLKQIQHINLARNGLVSIPNNTFSNLPSLKYLQLDQNYLESLDFLNNTGLTHLTASKNYIKEISNETFLNTPSLLLLSLSINRISFIHDNAFKNLKSLKSNEYMALNLQSNSMNSIPHALADFFLNKNAYEDGFRIGFKNNPLLSNTKLPSWLTSLSEQQLKNLAVQKAYKGFYENDQLLEVIIPNCCYKTNSQFLLHLANLNISLGIHCTYDGVVYSASNFTIEPCLELQRGCENTRFKSYDFDSLICHDNGILGITLVSVATFIVFLVLVIIIAFWYHRKKVKQKDLLDGLTPEQVF